MKRIAATTLCALALGAVEGRAQEVKIDRCEPAAILAGGSTEITLHGRNLEGAKLWISFPATVERLDEKTPKFRITTEFTGTGALRAYSEKGISDLAFLKSQSNRDGVVACAKRSRYEDAQEVEVPCVIEGQTTALASHFYRFSAAAGQNVTLHARANSSAFDGVLIVRSADDKRRLAFADDDEIYGADPRLEFTPPADGEYVVELIDSQFRGGLNFSLQIGGDSSSSPDVDQAKRMHDESGAEPLKVSLPETVYGRFDAAGDQDEFRFDAPAGTFLTITSKARSIRSPATPRLKLVGTDGNTLAETPFDAFDERQLRVKISKDEKCALTVEDAFGGSSERHVYCIELSTDVPPFALTIPRQGDKKKPLQDNFLATPGGYFVVPIQCQRHGFDKPIDLQIDGWSAENPQVEAKKADTQLRVRVPQNAAIGELLTFRVNGTASAGDAQFKTALRSGDALRERNPNVEILDALDGQLAVQVIASPLTIEFTPPEEVAPGSAATIPIKLVWLDENRKFNTKSRIVSTPPGVEAPEKGLNNKDTTTGLELKLNKEVTGELENLRIEVRIDYYKQPLIVQSAPFTIRVPQNDEKKE